MNKWIGILHALRLSKNQSAVSVTIAMCLSILMVPAAKAGVVLLYHHVDESTPAITSIAPDQFEKHLAIIEELGFEVLPLTELVEKSLTGDLEARQVAITFDDAYISIYQEAFPRLKERGWPFTIFVAPAFVSENSRLYLSWAQIKEMSQHGASIENHSLTHTHFVRRLEGESDDLWRSRVTAEITTAGDRLAEAGFETSQFAYPYGEYNLELLAIVESLNLQGFGQQSGAIGPLSNLQLLPRFPLAGVYVGEKAFRDKLRSLPLPIVHPEIDPLVLTDFRPPLTLDFLDPGVNTSRLTCYGPGGVMETEVKSPTQITVIPVTEISIGRSRYNCTLPKSNRFYWFSQLWLRKLEDGSWYPEP